MFERVTPRPHYVSIVKPCGAIEFQSIEDPQTAKVMNGEISINETR